LNQDERLGAIVDNYRKYFGDTAKVIVDAGTRDGNDAHYLQQKLNAERVIAIDANPLAIFHTKAEYPQFEVIETALADYIGEAEFDQIISEREDFAGSSSLTKARDFPGVARKTLTVKVTTMAELCDRLKIDAMDVVKVDLEGYTYEFLIGLGERIKQVKLFHLETETFKRHEGHRSNTEVIALMESQGFTLVDKSYEWGPTIEDQVWVNTAVDL
jgi:FkbM family methyltransferase